MDIKPENLISLLQQHKPLPQAQVLLLCGEEDYYRNSIIAALPEYVFGDTPEADREITVFDKDTNLSGLLSLLLRQIADFLKGRKAVGSKACQSKQCCRCAG